MAFVAGDDVYLLPHFAVGQGPNLLGGGGAPLLGVVDDVSSPTVIVTWGNGLTTEYLNDGKELSLASNPSPGDAALLHKRVTVNTLQNGPADPNGQGASEGLIINVFAVTDGITVSDFVVVKFSAGDIATFPATAVTPLNP